MKETEMELLTLTHTLHHYHYVCTPDPIPHVDQGGTQDSTNGKSVK